MDYKKTVLEWIDSMTQISIAKHEMKFTDDLRGEEFVLYYIYKQQGSVEPGELSKSLSLSTARVAKILQQLEDKKLLTREINLVDRRKIIVKLTEEGILKTKAKKAELVDKMARIMSMLGEEDTKEYLRITRKLAQIFFEIEKCS